MPTFFGKSPKKIIHQLQQRDYANMKEKLTLLAQLEEEEPSPIDCVWMLTDKDARYRETGSKIVAQDQSFKMLQILLKAIREEGANGRKPRRTERNATLEAPHPRQPYQTRNTVRGDRSDGRAACGRLADRPGRSSSGKHENRRRQ